MDTLVIIEIFATVFSLGFLFFLIRQNILAWPLGIVGSLLSIYLFTESKLYSEAILYGYYVLIGFYGWWNWSRPKGELLITTWKPRLHGFTIVIGAMLSLGLGYFFTHFSDADKPYLDATTTIFSFIASILEARKVLSTWIYWIIINGVTVGLYFSKSLDIYAAVMVIYFVMSIVGYRQWRSDYHAQAS